MIIISWFRKNIFVKLIFVVVNPKSTLVCNSILKTTTLEKKIWSGITRFSTSFFSIFSTSAQNIIRIFFGFTTTANHNNNMIFAFHEQTSCNDTYYLGIFTIYLTISEFRLEKNDLSNNSFKMLYYFILIFVDYDNS